MCNQNAEKKETAEVNSAGFKIFLKLACGWNAWNTSVRS